MDREYLEVTSSILNHSPLRAVTTFAGGAWTVTEHSHSIVMQVLQFAGTEWGLLYQSTSF